MFNINFIRLLNNFSLKRETADMAIRSWKSENKEIYQQFKSNIEKIRMVMFLFSWRFSHL